MKHITTLCLSLIIATFFVFSFFVPQRASAATLYLSSDKDAVNVGDTFEVVVKTDSEGVGINAAQATLVFPKELLEVTKVDTTGSIFNFWLKEPSFSLVNGRIDFIGGSNFGSSGKSLPLVKVNFKAKGSGKAALTFSDGVVTSSDGSGTNVLSVMRGLEIAIVPKTEVIETKEKIPSPSASDSQVTAIPQPVQITRPPAIVSNLPAKPTVQVSLYPDPEKWYANTAHFIAQWKLPADISAVSTALDRNTFYFGEKREGLFESRVFPAIKEEGIWYLHVRFKNNVGWGPSAHYRIAIDTAPPLSFNIKVLEGASTDNPAPTIQFKTNDSLSGLKEYHVQIDGGEIVNIPAQTFNGAFLLPLQPPGKKQVTIQATDYADNSIENSITVDILPIASPVITFVTQELFSDEEKGLTVKGASLPRVRVLLRVYRHEALVASGTANSDEKGNWEFTFDQPLKNGLYKVSVQNQDTRGALSLTVESPEIRVKSKPIVQIGAFQLGKSGAIVFLLVVLTVGCGGGIYIYRRWRETLAMRIEFTEAEVGKMFTLIREDAEKLVKARETPTAADDEYVMKKLQEHIRNMEAYIKRGIKKILG